MKLVFSCGMEQDDISYQLMNMDWRFNGPTCALAEKYLLCAKGAFSTEKIRIVMEVGNQLVEKYGDVRLAARQVQEIEMRTMELQVCAVKELSDEQPELRDQIVQLHTVGALPHFRGETPQVPRPSGLPYDSSKTVGLVGKFGKM